MAATKLILQNKCTTNAKWYGVVPMKNFQCEKWSYKSFITWTYYMYWFPDLWHPVTSSAQHDCVSNYFITESDWTSARANKKITSLHHTGSSHTDRCTHTHTHTHTHTSYTRTRRTSSPVHSSWVWPWFSAWPPQTCSVLDIASPWWADRCPWRCLSAVVCRIWTPWTPDGEEHTADPYAAWQSQRFGPLKWKQKLILIRALRAYNYPTYTKSICLWVLVLSLFITFTI